MRKREGSWDASFVVVDAIKGRLSNEAFRGGRMQYPALAPYMRCMIWF